MIDPSKLKIGDILRRVGQTYLYHLTAEHTRKDWERAFKTQPGAYKPEDFELVTVSPIPYVEPVLHTRIVHLLKSKEGLIRTVDIAFLHTYGDSWERLASIEVTFTEGEFVDSPSETPKDV